jgi:hypothetical protein
MDEVTKAEVKKLIREELALAQKEEQKERESMKDIKDMPYRGSA